MLTLRVADLRLGACCQGHSLEQPREGFSRCWLFLIKLIRENCCHRYSERTLPTTVRAFVAYACSTGCRSAGAARRILVAKLWHNGNDSFLPFANISTTKAVRCV